MKLKLPSLKSLNVPYAIFVLVTALLVLGLVGVYTASASLSGYEKRRVAQAQGTFTPEMSFHGTSYLEKQAAPKVVAAALRRLESMAG